MKIAPMSGRLTHAAVRALDRMLPKPKKAEHLQTGRRGEEEAYFYLRKLGYVMVARNWRSPRRKGELDLVGWDGDVLCFVEVKTRTTLDVKPAEAAVDSEKQQELCAMAQEFVRRYLHSQRNRLLASRARRGNATSETDLAAEAAESTPGPDAIRKAWRKLAVKMTGSGRAPSLPSGWEENATPKIRFDVLSIYYLEDCGKPRFTLFKNCFPMS